MARKSKGTSEATPKSTKRKIDWSTIDENGAFEGFELRPSKSTKKQRTETPQRDGKDAKSANMGAEITQKNVFEDAELSTTRWRVHPEAEWEGTGRYRKFTIDQAEFEVGDNVFIKPDASQAGSKDAPVQGWVARVLEVRAGDPNHVYLRIYWLYRPEDLPGGRRPYHGYNELIASNDMAIIDAMTVDGPANVIHWQEQKDQGEVLSPAQLFWRQTLDVTKKPPALSELPQHCIDFAPCNPDELLVQCESCDSWLHGSCLEDDALRDVYKQHDLAYPDDSAQSRPKGAKKKKRASKVPPAFSAQIVTTQSGKTRLTVTDKRSGAKGQKSWDVPVKCLLCPAIIEKVFESERVQRDSEETESASDRAEIPTSATVVKDGNVPATPANKDEDEDDEDFVVGNDISSPVKEELPDRTANPLEVPDVESTRDANTNGYSQNTAKKRKRGATDGSTKSSTGKKRRATAGAANISAEKKTARPITPTKDTAPDASVLQSGVKTLKRMLWQSK